VTHVKNGKTKETKLNCSKRYEEVRMEACSLEIKAVFSQ
jgi:hypothetical protein